MVASFDVFGRAVTGSICDLDTADVGIKAVRW